MAYSNAPVKRIPYKPIGKTYFIGMPDQLSGTDGVWDWVSETASGAYGWVTGKITGTWDELKGYYTTIKTKWPEFLSIKKGLDELTVKLSVMRMNAVKKKDNRAVENIDNLRLKLKSLMELWFAVKEKYDKYIGSWIGAEKKSQVSGLGIAPAIVVIAVAGIAAAAYVAKNMIDVIAEYYRQKDIILKTEQGLMTPQQAREVIERGRITKPSVTELVAEKLGTGMGAGLSIALVGAVVVIGGMYYMRRRK